ncbi:DUF2200 family protein [Aquimarina sp. 2-A2]|uniref:DUF2200 family protein n=1 Tax=Aquimarina sp. 2-A2 TaxID=3382644 RepID=UPI00387F14F8
MQIIDTKATFNSFFKSATLPRYIICVICGYRVETIEKALTQQLQYLNKLLDELAKGRKMEQILRIASN